VNGSTIGVLVSSDQHSERARQDYGRLVSMVSSGEVEGRVIDDEGSLGGVMQRDGIDRELVRRGAARGAFVGFLLGLMPLVASTLLGAAAGGVLAGASRLRFEKGSPPRFRFARHD
jgi:hypothetical protein